MTKKVAFGTSPAKDKHVAASAEQWVNNRTQEGMKRLPFDISKSLAYACQNSLRS